MPDSAVNENPATTTDAMSRIEINGNWFLKDGKRFLIKGIHYQPRHPNLDRYSKESLIDPLSPSWLPTLQKDISYFHKLGINALFINHFDISQPPSQALQLLQDAGIYILLSLFTNIKNPDLRGNFNDIDLTRLYSPNKVRTNLVLVDQTASFPNVLGYSISQAGMHSGAATRLAALHRAAVRDTKLFLQKRAGRQVPVGAMVDGQQFRAPALQYMSAGDPSERVDFMAFEVYDWAGPSDFQMSGYSSLVEFLGRSPVPMFFGGYGTTMPGRPRVLDEVACLYSPDMTGVFSGGFLETYGSLDRGGEIEVDEGGEEVEGGYDLVQIGEDGARREKKGFETFRRRLKDVEEEGEEGIVGSHEKKDFESWRGRFANGNEARFWLARAEDVPEFPLEWSAVLA